MAISKHAAVLWRRQTKGMALAMTAVMLPVLGLLLAFVVDIGLAATAQSRLEGAVNEAADLSAKRLPDEVGAQAAARTSLAWSLADVDSFGSTPVVDVVTTPDSITIEASMDARVFFGGLVGRESYALAASARRLVVPVP